jgi:hypothetical protein
MYPGDEDERMAFRQGADWCARQVAHAALEAAFEQGREVPAYLLPEFRHDHEFPQHCCPKCQDEYYDEQARKEKPRVENVCIVFDGDGPGVEGGRFVEVEDADGHSISIGRWEHSSDGLWRLWLDAERVEQGRANQDVAVADPKADSERARDASATAAAAGDGDKQPQKNPEDRCAWPTAWGTCEARRREHYPESSHQFVESPDPAGTTPPSQAQELRALEEAKEQMRSAYGDLIQWPQDLGLHEKMHDATFRYFAAMYAILKERL